MPPRQSTMSAGQRLLAPRQELVRARVSERAARGAFFKEMPGFGRRSMRK